jgi:hypothetical protein
MKIKYYLFAAFIIVSLSFNLPNIFSSLLKRAEMTFQNPSGFTETKVISNNQMEYEYAVKHPKKNFEVRYAIRPLDIAMQEYRKAEKNKKTGDVNISPNKIYEA